jgi:hypothetical protein
MCDNTDDITTLIDEIKSDVVSAIEDIDPSGVVHADRDVNIDIEKTFDEDGYPSAHQVHRRVIVSTIESDDYEVNINIEKRE